MNEASPTRSQQLIPQPVANSNETVPDPDQPIMKRLDTFDAFVVLFAISFGPAFVAVDLTVNQPDSGKDKELITIATLVGILIFFLFNIITIYMLIDVFHTKTLGSYQEVAYSISRGNRGYIFLISAMKAIYLGITASFCLEFCASYLTTIIQVLFMDENNRWPAGGIWGVYIACLFLFGALLLIAFLKSVDECFIMARIPSRILFWCAWISLALLIFLLLISINSGVADFMER